MNADNDYKIGYQHIVCEDYSLSGVRTDGSGAFAIVSDGCSAAADVDVGARILALSARELLAKMDDDSIYNKNGLTDYIEFGNQIIQRANTVPPLFPSLDVGALNATLLVAWVNKGILKVYMYGDGVFFRKTKDGVHAIHVSFDNNAPNYPIYLLDNKHKENYIKMGGKKQIHTCMLVDGKETTSNLITVPPFYPVMYETAVAEGDVIALCSDGINSFRTAESDAIPWQKMIDDYIGFKNFEGVFVKRQFAALERKCKKEGTTHFDDISIATICV